jgi:hypothetical protein
MACKSATIQTSALVWLHASLRRSSRTWQPSSSYAAPSRGSDMAGSDVARTRLAGCGTKTARATADRRRSIRTTEHRRTRTAWRPATTPESSRESGARLSLPWTATWARLARRRSP